MLAYLGLSWLQLHPTWPPHSSNIAQLSSNIGFWRPTWHLKSTKIEANFGTWHNFKSRDFAWSVCQKQGFRVECLSKINVSVCQNLIKNDKKSMQNQFKIGAQFLMHFRGQHGSKNPNIAPTLANIALIKAQHGLNLTSKLPPNSPHLATSGVPFPVFCSQTCLTWLQEGPRPKCSPFLWFWMWFLLHFWRYKISHKIPL